MVDNKHSTPPPKGGQVKEPPPKHPASPTATRKDEPVRPSAQNPSGQQQQKPNQPAGSREPYRAPSSVHGQSGAGAQGGEHRDPVLGTVDPLVRETETLPVEAHPGGADRGEPVGHARHAETPEEVEKISAMEGFGASSDRKVPPPGSRHFVAGQPVSDEEWEKTENEANRLAQAGREQRNEAEKRMAENTPGDPDYHPADPDKRDTDQALGHDPNKRGASDQPGQENPFPRGREEPQNNTDRIKNR